MKPPRINRLGFIGIGSMAQHHARAAIACGANIVAAISARPESPHWSEFDRIASTPRRETSVSALIEAEDVDGIIASASWDAMPRLFPALLTCPKPVLCEKPIALSVRQLNCAVKNTPPDFSQLQIAYNRRFYDNTSRVKKRITSGGLNAVRVLISEDVAGKAQRFGPGIAPHLLVFSSSHILDLLLYLIGPVTVRQVSKIKEDGFAGEFGACAALMETAEGIPVSLSISTEPSNSEMHFLFQDNTAWRLSPIETLTVLDGFEVAPPTSEIPVRRYRPHKTDQWHELGPHKPGVLNQMKCFLGIERYLRIPASVEDTLAILNLIEALATKEIAGEIPR